MASTAAWFLRRDPCCGGLSLETWAVEGDGDDDEVLTDQQYRRDYLVANMERNGIASAEHLRALSLQQLEEVHRMSEHYNEKHFYRRAHDHSESFPELEKLWDMMASDSSLWFPFSLQGCFGCYDLNTTTTTMASAARGYY